MKVTSSCCNVTSPRSGQGKHCIGSAASTNLLIAERTICKTAHGTKKSIRANKQGIHSDRLTFDIDDAIKHGCQLVLVLQPVAIQHQVCCQHRPDKLTTPEHPDGHNRQRQCHTTHRCARSRRSRSRAASCDSAHEPMATKSNQAKKSKTTSKARGESWVPLQSSGSQDSRRQPSFTSGSCNRTRVDTPVSGSSADKGSV